METVLIVDDDESTRRNLKRIIEKEGHPVLVAADGAEAAQVLVDSTRRPLPVRR